MLLRVRADQQIHAGVVAEGHGLRGPPVEDDAERAQPQQRVAGGRRPKVDAVQMGQDLDETVIDLVLVGCRLSPLGFGARMPDPLGRACLYPGAKRPAVTVIDVCIIRTARRPRCPRCPLGLLTPGGPAVSTGEVT